MLKGVTVWTMDDSLTPVSRIDADRAEFKDGHWTLRQLEVKDFSVGTGYRATAVPSMEVALNLKVDDLKVLDNNADNLSYRKLREYAQLAQQVGAQTQSARAKWQIQEIGKMAALRAQDTELALQEQGATDELLAQQAAAGAQAAAAAASRAKIITVKEYEARYVDFGGGAAGFARSPKEATVLRETAATRADFISTVQRLRTLAAKGSSMDLEERGEATALHARAISAIGAAQQMGAMAEHEVERAKNQLGELPTDVWKWDAKTVGSLDATIKAAAAGGRARVKAAQLIPARETPGAQGPTYEYLEPKAQHAEHLDVQDE